MKVIGLTGGIASGKTTVANLLAEKGAALIDTDLLAREVVEPGQPAYQDIVARFGPEVLRHDGTLDRARLGAIVFADPDARSALNGFTHPRIRQLMLDRLSGLAALPSPPPAAVLVIPLLFENRLESLVEETWLVALAEPLQRQRLIERDGFSPAEADMRIASQMALAEKRARATRVIENDGNLADLRAVVERTWRTAGLAS